MKPSISVLLASTLLLSTSIATFASSYSDTNNHWGSSYIEKATSAGLMSGTGDNQFSPNTQMTVAEFAVVIVNGAFHGETLSSPNSTHWGSHYIQVLIENGLLVNHFGEFILTMEDDWENQPMTRENVATVIARLLDNNGTKGDISNATRFQDVASLGTSHGQVQDIATVVAYGIMQGESDTEFGVGGSFTRAAASVVISNLLDKGLLTDKNEASDKNDVSDKNEASDKNEVTQTVLKYDMPADTNQDGDISKSELDAVFATFQKDYPQGTNWTNSNVYTTVRKSLNQDGSVSSITLHAAGCSGWAYMLQDAIYGNAPQYEITRDQVQAGDFWHTGSHWGVIMEVTSSGYITTEGNYNSSIYWNISRGTNYLTQSVTYYSRNPV